MGDDTPLASWNDGPAKAAILEFVRSVTAPGDVYVPVAERIVAFDNDGTLWCEKPMYVQADFVSRRWKDMVREDPWRATEQPYKALVEGDAEWLADVYAHAPELIKGVAEAYEGITTEAFEAAARDFFASATHPTLGVPYIDATYRPMRELIESLEGNGFSGLHLLGGRPRLRARGERAGSTACLGTG